MLPFNLTIRGSNGIEHSAPSVYTRLYFKRNQPRVHIHLMTLLLNARKRYQVFYCPIVSHAALFLHVDDVRNTRTLSQ